MPEAELLLPVPVDDAAFVLLPDFVAAVDVEAEVLPLAVLLPPALLAVLLPDLLSVVEADEPVRPPWPMLVSELASDWLEVVEPDERLLSLPLVRPEVEEPGWLLVLPCMPVLAFVPEVPLCVEPGFWALFGFLVLSAIVW